MQQVCLATRRAYDPTRLTGQLNPSRIGNRAAYGTQGGLFRGQGRYVKFILSGGVAP